MMANTIAIRNWAYLHQMERVYFDLTIRIDPLFEKIYGVTATTFVKTLFALIQKREDLLNEHLRKLRGIYRTKNYQEILEKYNNSFPENHPISPDEADELWVRVGKKAKNLASLLVCHADLKLESIYSFDLEDVRGLTLTLKEADALWNLLKSLSFQFGDLKEANKEHFILNNPTTRKPFIDIGKGKLFSANWRIIPHYAIDIFGRFNLASIQIFRQAMLRQNPNILKKK